MTTHHYHGHGHHGRRPSHHVLSLAIGLTLGFALVEVVTGWKAGSLALLGDAGHMASDAVALTIAAFAAWIARRPPSHKHSYGLGRAEVIAAWISSVLLLIISIAVIVEAFRRLESPLLIDGKPVMLVASLGILINVFIAWLLTRGERTLNVRAAIVHVMGDLLGSVAVLISGIVIHFTGWMPIDPILSIFIGFVNTLSH